MARFDGFCFWWLNLHGSIGIILIAVCGDIFFIQCGLAWRGFVLAAAAAGRGCCYCVGRTICPVSCRSGNWRDWRWSARSRPPGSPSGCAAASIVPSVWQPAAPPQEHGLRTTTTSQAAYILDCCCFALSSREGWSRRWCIINRRRRWLRRHGD